MASFLTNAKFAETDEVVELDAGLAAVGAGDGDGAARSEPFDASNAVNTARAIAGPTLRRNHRPCALLKYAPSITG
jgi:hypothetical protein